MSSANAALALLKSGLISEASEIRCYIGFFYGEHVFSLKNDLVASVDLPLGKVTSHNPEKYDSEFATAIKQWRIAATIGTEANRLSSENTARAMELKIVTGKFYCSCCMQERPYCKLEKAQ